jgi:hypothetical protein
MAAPMNKTLAATLIATGAGTGLWFLGIDKIVWPAHPGIAVLLITVVVGIVVSLVWPSKPGQ